MRFQKHLLALTTILLSLYSTGCPTGSADAPRVILNPGPLHFPASEPGESPIRWVHFINGGTSAVTFQEAIIESSPFSAPSITPPAPAGASPLCSMGLRVEPRSSCMIPIQFTPRAVGTFEGTLVARFLIENGADETTTELHGRGQAFCVRRATP